VGLNSTSSIYSIILPVGSWLLIGGIRFPNSATYSSISISQTTNAIDSNAASQVTASGENLLTISRIIVVTSGTQTWYLTAGSAGTAQTVTNTLFDGVRLG